MNYPLDNTFIDTTVLKGPRTARLMKSIPQTELASRWMYGNENSELKLRFFVPSAGGGSSKLVVSIGQQDLTRMLHAALASDAKLRSELLTFVSGCD